MLKGNPEIIKQISGYNKQFQWREYFKTEHYENMLSGGILQETDRTGREVRFTPEGHMILKMFLNKVTNKPTQDSEFDESKHPRGEDGRFGQANVDDFVLAPDGSVDFGSIPELDSKIESEKIHPSAPIRMEEGGEFGRAHIQPERLKAFKENGYASESEMLDDVAKHYTHIYEQPNGRLLLVKRNGRAKFSVVELQKQGEYYGVTTLFLEDASQKGKPYETRSGRKLLWPLAEAASTG